MQARLGTATHLCKQIDYIGKEREESGKIKFGPPLESVLGQARYLHSRGPFPSSARMTRVSAKHGDWKMNFPRFGVRIRHNSNTNSAHNSPKTVKQTATLTETELGDLKGLVPLGSGVWSDENPSAPATFTRHHHARVAEGVRQKSTAPESSVFQKPTCVL